MLALACAALWGFAEATLFFIVPDVLLSAIAIRDPRAAYRASFAAVGGTMIGGTILYLWGAASPEAWAVVSAVPAVGPEMMDNARSQLDRFGMLAVILGPLSATPFKVYAVQSSASGIPFWWFLAITPIARLPRFLLVSFAAGWICRSLGPRVTPRTKYILWACAWVAVYLVLWREMF